MGVFGSGAKMQPLGGSYSGNNESAGPERKRAPRRLRVNPWVRFDVSGCAVPASQEDGLEVSGK